MAQSKENKKSSVGDIIYRIIIGILILIMLFSGYKVYSIYSNYKQGTDVYDNIAEDVGAKEDIAHLDTRLHLDWAKLKEKNDDVLGWLRSVGTVINYPVVQGEDNDYYLTHLMDGTENTKGTLFVDMYCKNPFDDFLTVIYGHRMRDKSMFYTLGDYLEEKETPYFLEHPVMELYTPEQDYEVQIFGAAVVDSRDASKYNFNLYEEVEKREYIDWIFQNNQLQGYDNRVSVMPSDKIIMLSTCTLRGSAYDDNRVVVWGKLVPMAEEQE